MKELKALKITHMLYNIFALMWNPVKELKVLLSFFHVVLKNLWWNPVKELKAVKATTPVAALAGSCGIR